MQIPTSRGPASVTLHRGAAPARCLLVLTHGAGGGVDAPDLGALRAAATARGAVAAAVTQPYRVAGRRGPGGSTRPLDDAWYEVVCQLRDVPDLGNLPLVFAGRSNGARVACRGARALDARAVVALAFPLHPPGRPERSRDAELRAVPAACLVVNGGSDPFGVPAADERTTVLVRPGERHDLARDPDGTATLVVDWLAGRGLLAAAPE